MRQEKLRRASDKLLRPYALDWGTLKQQELQMRIVPQAPLSIQPFAHDHDLRRFWMRYAEARCVLSDYDFAKMHQIRTVARPRPILRNEDVQSVTSLCSMEPIGDFYPSCNRRRVESCAGQSGIPCQKVAQAGRVFFLVCTGRSAAPHQERQEAGHKNVSGVSRENVENQKRVLAKACLSGKRTGSGRLMFHVAQVVANRKGGPEPRGRKNRAHTVS
jgi:hypothetical protein